MIGAPGQFQHGHVGPAGRGWGHGLFPEPDFDPAFDFLDEKPTLEEIGFLRGRREGLYTETAINYQPAQAQDGYYCHFVNNHAYAHRLHVFSHDLTFNGNVYPHHAILRYPEIDPTVWDPNQPYPNDLPLVVLCHGARAWSNEITYSWLNDWSDYLFDPTFFRSGCYVLMPLYYGFQFETHDPPNWCRNNVLIPNGFSPLVDGSFGTQSTQQFEDDYHADGYTQHDVFVMAILHSLAAIREHFEGGRGLTSQRIGFMGASLGAGMTYQTAPLLVGQNPDSPRTEVAVAFFGPTDEYANFARKRYKRYRASKIRDPGGDDFIHTYSDLTANMQERCTSPAVEAYIADPTEERRANLRYAYLGHSVAEWWDYEDGPYPLLTLHGTADDTVMVANSRWLAQEMRLHGVPRTDAGYQYLETSGGIHAIQTMKPEYRVIAGDLLEQQLTD